MKTLTLQDFEILKAGWIPYYSFKWGDGYEVCLEFCLDGFDVAVYQYEGLLEDKFCTDLADRKLHLLSVLNIAIQKANQFYQKYPDTNYEEKSV